MAVSRVRLQAPGPQDSLRAHAQEIVKMRLRQLEEQPAPPPPGLHPAQASRGALPPKYSVLSASKGSVAPPGPMGQQRGNDAWEYEKIPRAADVMRAEWGNGPGREKEAKRQAPLGRAIQVKSGGVYGRLGQERTLPRVQSLPAIQMRSPHGGHREAQAMLRGSPQRLLDIR